MAYRPVNIWNLQCFWSALKLYERFTETHPPGMVVATNDHLEALFGCKYYAANIGNPGLLPWSALCNTNCYRYVRFFANHYIAVAQSAAMLYGPRYTFPLPLFIWKKIGNVTVVKDAGVIVDYGNGERASKILLGMKELFDKGYALMYCCNKTKKIYKLYVPVPSNNVVVRARFYADLNGTYTFWVSPAVVKVTIDGKTYISKNQKRMMYDFMYGKYLATIKLSAGWHNITIVTNRGFMAIYWKTPLSCGPHPIFGFHLHPPSR